jgi:integrase
MGIQLYSHLKYVKVPGNAWLSSRNTYVYRDRSFDDLPLFRWPDGRPCHIANHWMMHVSSGTQAKDTARVYASQITHLIRYCYLKKIEFFELTDNYFYHFTKYLKQIKKKHAAIEGESIGSNHIRAIQLRCLRFLIWISQNFAYLSVRCLIGTKDKNPNIVIRLKSNTYTGQLDVDHPYLVESEPYKDDKAVITEAAIRSIQNAIYEMSLQAPCSLTTLGAIQDTAETTHSPRQYLYERRMFTIRMMKLTGLRPEELVDIPLDLNDDVLSTLYLCIPTKKQGVPAPIRKFKITLRAAIDFNRYLTARKNHLQALNAGGIFARAAKAILLTNDGRPLSKQSLTREFSRICVKAKLGNLRTCLSMFRHRFVTREIHTLLLSRFERAPSLKITWTEGLREDVCFLVIQKTGHKKTQSIYEYFHHEYNLLTGQSDRASIMSQRERLDAAQEALIDLKFKSTMVPGDGVEEEIQELESDIESLYKKIYGYRT